MGKIILYIIHGVATGKKYVGITNNLQRRLNEHRSGRTRGGRVIGDFELVHTEECEDYATARKKERYFSKVAKEGSG